MVSSIGKRNDMASNPHQHNQLLTLFAAYAKRLDKLYDDFVTRLIATLPLSEDEVWQKLADNPLFLFDDLPYLKARLQHIFDDYVNKQVLCYKAGITDGVALAFSQDKINLGKYTILQDEAIKAARNAAVTSFIANRMSRKEGLSLSDKVWNYSQLGKSEVEMGISNVIKDGLKAGTSAEELGRKVRQYLNNPTMMYRRYWVTVATAGGGKKKVARWYRRHIDEKTGKVTFKDEPLERVGTGVYRSARMNGYRLMRTEINMSYHKANASRWANEPFVYGIRIWKSPEHPKPDICDDLEGYYPKQFVFSGWHPACYLPGTKVLTKQGWKLLQDVEYFDRVLSLNPATREIEYVGVTARQAYWYNGEVEHFFNRSLDCEVTADHRMVYLNKSDGKIKYTTAKNYRKGNGAIYRGCEYGGADKPFATIGNEVITFDLFCEFMGYWLADGSLRHDAEVVVSQMENQPPFATIRKCLEKMGHRVYYSRGNLSFRDKALCAYLQQFGKSNTKYVPDEIMCASKRQIKIFLDAFVKCDGHEKQPHPFIGSHGNIFIPKSKERTYFTTSPRMCGNLCELLLKIGHRPSIGVRPPSTVQKKDGSIIKGNYDCYTISECHAQTATVFDKESYHYDGMVYDLTLAKNHIMYVQYNDTCFWGSNCLCASAPLTLYGDEKRDFYRRLMKGEDMSNFHSVHEITEKNMNPKWKHYIETQHDAILKAGERGKLAYHLRDNQQYWINQFSKEEQKKMGLLIDPKERIKQIADARHAARTPKQAKALTDWWHEHKRKDEIKRIAEARHARRNDEEVLAILNVRRNAKTIAQTYKDYRINADGFNAAVKAFDWARAKKEYDLLAPRLAFEKSITPDILVDSVMRKKYGDAAVEALYKNTARTMSKYDGLDIKGKIDKYTFEANWVRQHRSFATVQEVAAFYEREVERLKAIKDFEDVKKQALAFDRQLTKLKLKPILNGTEQYWDKEVVDKALKKYDPFKDKLRRLQAVDDFITSVKPKSNVIKQLWDGIEYAITKNGLQADIEDTLTKLESKIAKLKKKAFGKTVTLDDLSKALGTDMPKTLENLQSLIDSRLASASLTADEQTEFAKKLRTLFANSDYCMNVPRIDRNGDDVIEKIFNSYFKNQIETGTGKGMVDVSSRKRASQVLFGTDTTTAQAIDYEKYGFLADKDILKQAKSGIAGQYWSRGDGIQVRFKKDKVIATFTLEDSLGSGRIPSLCTDPKITSGSNYQAKSIIADKQITSAIQATHDWASSYIELQYHGQLTLDCIESVYIPKDVVGKIATTTQELIAKSGAKIYSEDGGKLIEMIWSADDGKLVNAASLSK